MVCQSAKIRALARNVKSRAKNPGSEEAIRKALVERHPRESFMLASKNAAWLKCKSEEEAKAQLDVSLERSGAEYYFDFYLLHNLGEPRTRTFDGWGPWDWALEQRAAEEGFVAGE